MLTPEGKKTMLKSEKFAISRWPISNRGGGGSNCEMLEITWQVLILGAYASTFLIVFLLV